MPLEKTLEEKVNKLLLELVQYRARKENLMMTAPDRDDYVDLPKFKFLDSVIVISGFFEWVEWTIGAIKNEIPEVIDHSWNILEPVVVTYGVIVKNYDDNVVVVNIDAKELMYKLVK